MNQILYIVRHGETDANVKGLINDKNVVTPLNANGKKQATITGKYFNNRKMKNIAIYTSPSTRAVQTAELIAKELKFNKTTIIKDARLDELDHGLLSGIGVGDKVYNDFMKWKLKTVPNDIIDLSLSYDISGKYIVKNYGMESDKHVTDRIKGFLKSLPSDKKNIIIVTHSGIIQRLVQVVCNIMAFNVTGDLTNGKNCTIMSMLKEKNRYKVLTLPNTLHLG